jgi:hypothetical protein
VSASIESSRGGTRRVARFVGATTAASGASLIAAPRLSLRAMGAATGDPAPLLFRVVGMFMVVVGGQLVDASRAGDPPAVVQRWAIAQKVGATTAMTAGVAIGTYRRRALAVAAFDGASAIALLVAARRRRA